MALIKNIAAAVLVALCLVLALPAAAQAQAPAAPAKCEGPAELCQKMAELTAALEAQKKAEANDLAKAKADDAKEKDERMAKLVAAAAVMAVVLRSLLLSLQSWKEFFTTDKGKAWLKVITLGVGFVAFIMTNIGFGIPWWQALILGAGGPGAILVHELMKMIPVIRGQKKYAEAEAEPKPEDKPAA